MTSERDHVRQCLAEMVAIEGQLEAVAEQLVPVLAGHPGTQAALQQFPDEVRARRQALTTRLETIGGAPPDGIGFTAPLPSTPVDMLSGADQAPRMSAALQVLYIACNHAALGYAMLHAVAHRAYDSTGEGNTADLAERHLREYAAAAQTVNQAVSDAVLWELSQLGGECQCECPACGIGLCLCASHGTNTINQAWRETTPQPQQPGLVVRAPRMASPAAAAGLRPSDVVLAIGDREIASDLDAPSVQAAIRTYDAGQPIPLRLRDPSGELLDVTLHRA